MQSRSARICDSIFIASIVTVAVKAGQAVKAGDPLVSIEAMKMESQIRAERDCIVRLTHVKPGDTVAAHDLLLEFQ